MIVSVTAFLVDFPEFKNTDRLLIERKLLNAENVTPVGVWGDKQRMGIMYKAAELISLAPTGEQAKLSDTDVNTSYGIERRRLEGVVSFGLRLI